MENKPNLRVSYCYRRLGKVERWREIAVNTDMCAPVCCGLKSVPMRPIDTKAAMVFTFHQHTHTSSPSLHPSPVQRQNVVVVVLPQKCSASY